MSTQHDPITLIGIPLETLYEHDSRGFESMYDLREYFEGDGLQEAHHYETQIIGIALPVEMEVSLASVNIITKAAKEFKRITGVEGKIYACVSVY